jgi:hypothetical protein
VPSSLLVFWSAFDSMPFGPRRKSVEWVERRFRHWQAFTLASVLGQTEGEFRYWLVCDPANRAVTEPLRERVRDERVRLVYTDEWPRLLRELPRAKRYLLARLDSDDLYHPGVAAEVLAVPAGAEFLQFNRGYACDLRSGEVRDWVARSSPFYCRVHGEEVRRLARWEVTNHTTVRPRARVLRPGSFLVMFHGHNTSSRIELGAGPLAGEPARRVLRSFGLGADRRLAGAGEPAPPSFRPDALVPYLCRRAAARRVLALGDGAWARAARVHAAGARIECHARPASVDPSPLYDLVVQDVAEDGGRPGATVEALRSVLPTGLLLLPHGTGEELRDWVFDRYPEVASIGGDGRRSAALLGRLFPAAPRRALASRAAPVQAGVPADVPEDAR